MQPTLLILAAGMGSRYGGLKQLDQMGPSEQTILDYAIHDAIAAGFGKAVFVIRKDFEKAFREQITSKYAEQIETVCVFQQIDDLPDGFTPPSERIKPWGTAHAIRAARKVIQEPFAIINADDFYGREAYAHMACHLSTMLETDSVLPLSMVGYPLQNTLSPHGSVNRGVCRTDGKNLLSVEEYTEIQSSPDGVLKGKNQLGQPVELSPKTTVSMNFWGASPTLFKHLEEGFVEFLAHHIQEAKAEYYIPTLIDGLIKRGVAQCRVLHANSPWFGVTYPEDKQNVLENIGELTRKGIYHA